MIQSLKNRKIISFMIMLLLIGTTTILSGCKKDEPDNNNNNSGTSGSNVLVLKQQEATPYQYVQVQLPDGSQPKEVQNDIIEVKISDSITYAFRFLSTEINQNTYVYQLLMPQINIGKHKISTTLASGKLSEAEITVKSLPEINDPNNYINTYFSEIKQEEANIITKYDNLVNMGALRQSAADSMKQFVQDWYKKIPDFTNKLNDEGKKIFAYLVEANKPMLSKYKENASQYNFILGKTNIYDDCLPLYQEYKTYSRNMETQDWATESWIKYSECKVYNDNARTLNFNNYSSALKSAWKSAEAAYHAGKRGDGYLWGVECFVKTYFSATADDIAKQKQTKIGEYGSFGVKSIHDAKQKSTLTFLSGEESNLSAGLELINLSRENANFAPEFTQFIENVDKYNETLIAFNDYLPSSVPPSTFPSSKTEQKYSAGYTIDQISDSRIKAETIKGEKGKKIKFTTEEAAEPKISFTFRMSYNSQYGNVSKTIDAELLTNSIYGKWNVEKTYFSDDNTPGSFEPGQGAYVLFETNGTYSVYDKFGQLDVSLPYTYDKDNKLINIKGSDPFTYKITLFTNNQLVLRYAEKDVIEEVYLKR